MSSRTEFAWLEVDGTWRCAGDPHFEIAVPDGPPVRVTTDPSTDWPLGIYSGYSGPWSELEEHDGSHPFRDEDHGGDFVTYKSITLGEGAAIEIWGTPEYAAGGGSYRENERGALRGIAASRVRRDWGDAADPLSRWKQLGVVAALVIGVWAAFTAQPFSFWRVALVVALGSLRALHREASPFALPEPMPSYPLARSGARTMFWAYLVIAFVLPIAEDWTRALAGALFALITLWWAAATVRDRRPAVVRALLSAGATEGIVEGNVVRTPSAALRPEEIAITLTDRLAGWETVVAAEMASAGFSRVGGDCALVAPLEGKWALVRAYRRAASPGSPASRFEHTVGYVPARPSDGCQRPHSAARVSARAAGARSLSMAQ